MKRPDAFLEDFGVPESDEGEWIDIGHTGESDDERVVRIRVRPIPEEVSRANMRRHTRNETFINNEGVKVSQPVAKSWEDNLEFAVAQASWALSGAENLSVVPRDAEAAKRLGRMIGRDQLVAVDDVVILDDKLSDAVKKYLMEKYPALRGAVMLAEEKIRRERGARLKVLEGNS